MKDYTAKRIAQIGARIKKGGDVVFAVDKEIVCDIVEHFYRQQPIIIFKIMPYSTTEMGLMYDDPKPAPTQ